MPRVQSALVRHAPCPAAEPLPLLRRADDALTEDVVRGASAVFTAFGAHLPVDGASTGRLHVR